LQLIEDLPRIHEPTVTDQHVEMVDDSRTQRMRNDLELDDRGTVGDPDDSHAAWHYAVRADLRSSFDRSVSAMFKTSSTSVRPKTSRFRARMRRLTVLSPNSPSRISPRSLPRPPPPGGLSSETGGI